jgi:hypothetical protein
MHWVQGHWRGGYYKQPYGPAMAPAMGRFTTSAMGTVTTIAIEP